MKKDIIPGVGELVQVTVKLARVGMAVWTPETETYVGRIVKNPPWIGDDQFSMSCDLKTHPIRIIPRDWIVSLKHGDVEVQAPVVAAVKPQSDQSWKIAGSAGKVYNVSKQGKFWRCNCVAGGFNKPCKHIKAAQELAAQTA